jgi:CDP-glucose 4,6-dehydratase
MVMSNMADFWRDKRVFLTGHTGFKGGWLALWLQSMGAHVTGYALKPPTETNFFEVCGVTHGINSVLGDIRDLAHLTQAVCDASPEIVIHMAAQPLVRYSYDNPVETYATNVMGTVHLLEAVRQAGTVKAVVNVTTDKCYQNNEWVWAYRENEPMGGADPYSNSKGCAELVTAAYRDSFLRANNIAIASARAGNVFGGGDWAQDRLIPDFLRAIDQGQILTIRAPNAIRPWQHVLEPLSGYLQLAQQLYTRGDAVAQAWNFGPSQDDARTVEWIVQYLAGKAPNMQWQCEQKAQVHEAHNLTLDSSKARAQLDWCARWSLATALDNTWAWHDAWRSGQDMRAVSLAQIDTYVRGAQ